ncbi:MAG: glycosyltransferase, partial [Acidobacteriota bacterium]
MKPRFSVIVPVHDDAAALRGCLESLSVERSREGEGQDDVEILVVDDGSRDHPERVVADFRAELLRLDRQSGAAAARNAGARRARGEVLLFTDADCRVMPGWARTAGEALLDANRLDPGFVALSGRLDSTTGYAAMSHAYAGYGYVLGGPAADTECFNTANAAILRRTFFDLGGFEESLAAHEDHDFGLRLAASPGRAGFRPDLVVHHDHGVETFRAMLAKHGRWGRIAGLRIEERHPQRLGPLLPWLRRGWAHLPLVVPLALLSTFKILRHNASHDRRVLRHGPGILAAKIAFRFEAYRYRNRSLEPPAAPEAPEVPEVPEPPESKAGLGAPANPNSEAESWKRQDRRYHERPEVAASYDRRVARFYRLDHKRYTLGPWSRLLAESGAAERRPVLDFGCGTGHGTFAFERAGFDVVSADASFAMLRRVQAKAAQRGVRAACVLVDGERLPFRSGAFGAVVCTGVLHHMPDPVAGVRSQARVLGPGGHLFISEPYSLSPWHSKPGHLLFSLARRLRDLLRRRGPGARERALPPAAIEGSVAALDELGFTAAVRRFTYWPYVCGYLPEGLAWPL